MKRYMRAALIAALVAGGFGSAGCASTRGCSGDCGSGCTAGGCGAGGCGDGQGTGNNGRKTLEDCYRNAVDVSWPDRYNFAARESVLGPFGQQVANGHFLDQTVWNWYFEPGTDKLTPGGFEKLDTLARTTPAPDPRIYIQTAHDVSVTPENMDKLAALRDDLNAKRAVAIKRYLTQQFGPPAPYELAVHDAPVPGIAAPFAMSAYRGQLSGYKGGLTGAAGSQVPGGSGGGGSLSGQSAPPVAPSGGTGAGTGGPGASPPPTTGP